MSILRSMARESIIKLSKDLTPEVEMNMSPGVGRLLKYLISKELNTKEVRQYGYNHH